MSQVNCSTKAMNHRHASFVDDVKMTS